MIATHGKLDELAVTPIGLFWGIFSAFTYALYIILPGKLIRQYGSITVIGLGMLMGGFVVTLGLQTWQHRLPIDGGSFLGLLGIVGVRTILPILPFLKASVWLVLSMAVFWPRLSRLHLSFLQYGWSMNNFMQLILLECC